MTRSAVLKKWNERSIRVNILLHENNTTSLLYVDVCARGPVIAALILVNTHARSVDNFRRDLKTLLFSFY